ncbi:MAG: T9SS type A sorting domain-containing protein [Saprospiraceae bacterium]|nr:T9SS type A sorting domain-containing protein [Saprospiraceae bacterium]
MKTTITIFFFLSISFAFGQSFSFHSYSPFNLKVNSGNNVNNTIKFLFADLDNDGDLDVLHSGISSIDDVESPNETNIRYFIEKQINIGTNKIPMFGPRTLYMQDFPMPSGYFIPAAGDINKDKKLDLIVCCEITETHSQNLLYYLNTGTSLNPTYQIINSISLNLDPFMSNSFYVPELVDLNGDDDLDILLSGHQKEWADTGLIVKPTILYAKNIGTPSTPYFLGWFNGAYNLNPTSESDQFVVTGDLDQDGDIDALGGEFRDSSTLTYFENVPLSNGKSHFLEPTFTLFGMPFAEVDENLFFPALADLDGDQDLDMFITRGKDEGFLLEYYRNDQFSGTSGNELFDAIEISPNPAKNEVNIINKSHFQIDRLNIYNSYGVLIYEFANHPDRIDLKPLSDGIYVLEVFSGKTSIRKKLVVMK